MKKMKRAHMLCLALMTLCAGFALTACGDDEEEEKLIIDPVEINVAGLYKGTTQTTMMVMGTEIKGIPPTEDQLITISKDEQGTLALTYHNWTDHQGTNYGDFHIVPLKGTAIEGGYLIEGECTDSLYKEDKPYFAELSVEGTVTGEEKVADLTVKVLLHVGLPMPHDFTLKYNGTAQ